MVKKILIALVIVLIIIQFIRPAKNISTVPHPQDIHNLYTIPDSIDNIMAVACYDCHSDNTRYPWYNNIQPVAWWLRSHINDGKRHVNFSEFGSYSKSKQRKKLLQVAKTVKNGSMPLNSYTWIHKDAILTPVQKQALIDWATNTAMQIDTLK